MSSGNDQLSLTTVSRHQLHLQRNRTTGIYTASLESRGQKFSPCLAFSVAHGRREIRITPPSEYNGRCSIWLGSTCFHLPKTQAVRASTWLDAHDAEATPPACPQPTEGTSA